MQKLLILPVLLLIISCSGSGGSSSPNVSIIVPGGINASDYETSEYYIGSLDSVRASEAYAYIAKNVSPYRVAGTGVVVGAVDDGYVQHFDLQGQIILSRMFNGQTPQQSYSDHGVAVLSVMVGKKNDIGSHGIAYNAKGISAGISMSQADQDFYTSSTEISNAVNYIINNNGRVVNMSFSSGRRNDSTFNFISSILASKNVLFTISAGNDMGSIPTPYYPALISSPSLGYNNSINPGIALTVISLANKKTNLEKSIYSNACGATKNYCLGAVGDDIYAASFSGFGTLDIDYSKPEYAYFTGTSFAAPLVGGAAAVLMSAYPDLSAYNVGMFLLRGAKPLYDSTDSLSVRSNPRTQGQNGNLSDVYGWGALDLYASVLLVENMTNTATGQSLGASKLSLSPLTANLSKQGAVNAKFTNDFASLNVNLSDRISMNNRGFSFENMLIQNNTFNDQQISLTNLGLSFNLNQINLNATQINGYRVSGHSLSNISNVTYASEMSFGSKKLSIQGLYNSFGSNGLARSEGFSITDIISHGSMEIPYLQLFPNLIRGVKMGFANQNQEMYMAYIRSSNNQEINASTGLINNTSAINSNFGTTNNIVQGAILSHFIHTKNTTFSSALALVTESGSMLGMAGSGMFQIEGTTSTFVTLGAKRTLPFNLDSEISMTGGITNFNAAQNSIISSDGRLITNSAKISINKKIRQDDKISLNIFAPLAISRGYIGFNNSNVNMASKNREVDVELSYKIQKFKNADISLNYLFAKNQYNLNQDRQYIFVAFSRAF